MRRAAVLVALLLATAAVARAEVEVSADVESDRVAQSDGVVFQVTVSGASSDVEAPDLPAMDGLTVVGTSQQSQINIVNMRMARSIVFVYQLAATKTGRLRIPSATVRVAGRSYRTRPIDVTVVPDGSGGGRGAPPPSSPRDEEAPAADEAGTQDTFLQVVVDPPAAVVGQKVIVSYYLVTRAQLTGASLSKQPTFSGFWSEPLEAPSNLGWAEVTVNGARYRKALLRRYAVFPLAPGDLPIDTLALQVERRVQARSRDPFGFDDMFGMMGRRQTIVVTSPARTLKARDVPVAGRPANFAGAVGTFAVETKVDSPTVKSGDALTLHVFVDGDGNVRSLKPPVLALPPGFKEYAPKESVEASPDPVDFHARKEFAFILVPEADVTGPAAATLPPVEVPYFDPAAGAYRVARSAPIAVTVTPGEPGRRAAEPLLSKEQVQLQGRELRYIRPNRDRLPRAGGHLLRRRGAVVLLAAYPLLVVGAYFGARLREKRGADVLGARRRGAGRQARVRLKEAERLLAAGQGVAFFAETQRAITQFVADVLGAPAAGLTPADVQARLAERGVDAGLVAGIGETLTLCDLHRFGRTGADAAAMRAVLDRAADQITRLDREEGRR